MVLTNPTPAPADTDAAALGTPPWMPGTLRSPPRMPLRTPIHRKTERAIKAYCRRERLSRLGECREEIYLLPEEI